MERQFNGFADEGGEAGEERNHVNGGGSVGREGRRKIDRQIRVRLPPRALSRTEKVQVRGDDNAGR